ncbi:hypothetical protein MPL3365_170336 [Mesorhizobium plurifarium]|uniref:Uncharacterized protein n=1 Tax=Mesorhizobium plurifarium TaxID=69974 RepID=A0A090G6F9_MESPL|nr:hypothetical protein MPL3365_170336 [Mesorhizobium plurifarium]
MDGSSRPCPVHTSLQLAEAKLLSPAAAVACAIAGDRQARSARHLVHIRRPLRPHTEPVRRCVHTFAQPTGNLGPQQEGGPPSDQENRQIR